MKKIEDYSFAISSIRNELKNYIKKSGLKSLVLGVSGGMDSALVAVLSKPVCDELGIPLIGRSITIETNKPEEIERARLIGECFCTNFKEIDLTEDYLYLKKTYENIEDIIIDDDKEDEIRTKIRFGNIKARIRMIYLYDLAQKNKGMVLSTDNKSEYLLGYWTIFGDCGDYGMIQNIWKTEVYEMSRFLSTGFFTFKEKNSLLQCVSAVPTDGLGITNSDLDQIGADSYEDVDKILIDYLETGNISNPQVISRHLKSEFKRQHPHNQERSSYFR